MKAVIKWLQKQLFKILAISALIVLISYYKFSDSTLKDKLENIKNIVEITGFLLAGLIAFRINWKFVPVIYLDITSEWIDESKGQLKLKLTIENKADVKALVESVQLQVLEYNLNTTNILSEWVPFHKNKTIPNENPISWNLPVNVWQKSEAIYPGEVTSLDYMCQCQKGNLVHVGLLFKGRTDYLINIFDGQESWCTTKIFWNK